MRTARRTSLALVTTMVGLSLATVGAPSARAAETVAPTFGTSDAGTSFTLSGLAATNTETVTLTLTGHPDIAGTVTHPDANALSCNGLTDSGCGSTAAVAVDLTNAFPGVYDIVRTQTPAGLSPTPTPTTTTLAHAYTVKSKPVVTSITPATRGQDSSSSITITGKGFGPGPNVSFGGGIVVSDVSYVSGTSITATVAVPAAAALGARDLSVTSADDYTGSLVGALTVTAAPTLTSVAPASAMRGESKTGVVFTGTGFATGGDFAITINGVVATNPVVSGGGTTVTANLAVSTTAISGNRAVLITNADGGRARLLNGFRVIAAPGAPAATTALPQDGKVLVAWSAPVDPGSTPVTSYTITPSNPAITPVTVAGTARQVLISGLTNGVSYTFDVTAKNDEAGVGPKATTKAVTPKIVVNLSALSNRATAISSQSAVIYGYLTRATTGAAFAATAITLKITPAVGAASTRSLVTDAHGRWSTSIPLTYSTTFAATYAGSSNVLARTTTVIVPVGTHIVVTSPRSSSTSSVRSVLTIRGTVSPSKAGKTVGIYKVVGGVAHLIGKGTIAANNTFAANIRLPYGNYLLKVVLGPVSGNSTGTSAQFVIKRR